MIISLTLGDLTAHLKHMADVGYHACRSIADLERWQEAAERWTRIANSVSLDCRRAHDHEQLESAVAILQSKLSTVEGRIAEIKRKSILNPAQLAAAEKLRGERPRVYAGTHIIFDEGERWVFYNKVIDEMRKHHVEGVQGVSEFFDIVGVAE